MMVVQIRLMSRLRESCSELFDNHIQDPNDSYKEPNGLWGIRWWSNVGKGFVHQMDEYQDKAWC